MNIYIFELNQVSGNYHSGGGLVVVAESVDNVKAIITAERLRVKQRRVVL